jgi:uncharacterized coiled-coil protein SlyX
MAPTNGPHVVALLQEHLTLLTDEFGAIDPKHIVMYNLSNALIGIYRDMEAEFRQLNRRLTNLERRLPL